MCGGSGTRLWPISRQALPKPFLPLVSEETLFEQALARVAGDARLAAHRWPAQVAAMIQRRSDGGALDPTDEPGLSAALSYAVGAEGRARIADAVRLSLWLRRD